MRSSPTAGPSASAPSIGLARMDPDLQEADALMIAADQAYYAAKHGGRGHVVDIRCHSSPRGRAPRWQPVHDRPP